MKYYEANRIYLRSMIMCDEREAFVEIIVTSSNDIVSMIDLLFGKKM